jgi:hypothetical protein
MLHRRATMLHRHQLVLQKTYLQMGVICQVDGAGLPAKKRIV